MMPERGGRVEGLTEQQQLAGQHRARPPRQQQAAGAFRAQPQLHEGHVEARALTGHHVVTVQQHRRADAHRRPVHRREHRLGRVHQGAQEAEHRAVLARGGVLHEVANVIAGGEDTARAGEQHHADVGVGLRLPQRVSGRLVHGDGEGVLLLGPVEGEGEDP
jgi:hypothetical protein